MQTCMDVDKNNLPDDPVLLQKIITEISDKYKRQLQEEQSKYQELKEKFQILQKMYFGRKSEKLTQEDEDQILLFNEAEDGSNKSDQSTHLLDEQSVDNTIEVKNHIRKKSGRKPIPDNLPREEKIYELPEEEKKCQCCGRERPVIGKEESEEMDIIPAQIKVIRHVQIKYGPCKCDESLYNEIPEIKTAHMPERMIPRSIAAPGMLAYVFVSKFADSLPFYRQSKIFKRIDSDISRATMCNWAIAAADRCRDLIDLMIDEIRGGPLIQMDETTVQVLHEPDRPPESKSYMWVAVGFSNEGRRLVLYQYHPTRSQNVPTEFLKNYSGYLQTDGYAGYNQAGSNANIIHVGCFAHARRKFYNALELNKKSKAAHKGMLYIQKIYKIENDVRSRDHNPENFVIERKKTAQPILDEFHNWLMAQKDSILPQSRTGIAINYTLSEWEKLTKFLDHHLLTPDNNTVENAIRPFAVGRKNWLFSNTPRGAHSSAIIYSLVESAKINNLDPYKYLRYLFTFLPLAKSNDELKRLLPNHILAGNLNVD